MIAITLFYIFLQFDKWENWIKITRQWNKICILCKFTHAREHFEFEMNIGVDNDANI
jgi:hypothetical protein